MHQLTYLLDNVSYKLLNQIVTASTLKNREYEHVFAILHRELEDQKIPYAVIKGFHLNNSIYANGNGFIMRDYNDIDLLVNRNDLSKVNEVLREVGFLQGNLNRKTLSIEPCSRKERIDMLINTHQEYQHIKPSIYSDISPYNFQLVDVNFTIWEGGNQPDYIEVTQLLEQRVLRTSYLGMDYWTLQPQYDLIQLCYHFYKDTNYEIKKKKNESLRIIHLYDLLFLLRRYKAELNLNLLYEIITAAHIENQIYFVLSLVQSIFSCEQLDGLLNELSSMVTLETKEKIDFSLNFIKSGL